MTQCALNTTQYDSLQNDRIGQGHIGSINLLGLLHRVRNPYTILTGRVRMKDLLRQEHVIRLFVSVLLMTVNLVVVRSLLILYKLVFN